MGTNFSEWTKEEIVSYLERVGEDHDDCTTLDELVQRAQECEAQCGVEKVVPERMDEEDPLDAFMKGIDEILTKQGCGEGKGKGELMVNDDPGMEFLQVVDKNHGREEGTSIGEIPEDRFKEIYTTIQKPDHSKESYQAFRKNFVGQVPPAMDTFDTVFGNDVKLMAALHQSGFTKPTQIQSKAIPEICMGKDCLGIAETGSGKTLAFVLPMVAHVEAQQRPSQGEGPIALILAPTRELAEQIHKETRKFGSRTHGLKSCAAFGGLDKYHQIKEMKAGVDIAVATPGRLLDLIKSKACSLRRVTYLVIDEADRMLDLGFEPQVQAIVSQIRPDRQVVMFSATMPHKVRVLAKSILKNHITVNIKKTAKGNIRQSVLVTNNLDEKKAWLLKRMEGFIDQGNIIIFGNQKSCVEDLFSLLSSKVARVGMLHGDMDQGTRMEIISSFRSGTMHVLIATDIAARGLDIDTVKVVINFDMPKDLSQYIHRIGRTGRGQDKDGEAFSLVLPHEHKEAAFVAKYLQECGIQVPQYVLQIANKHNKRKMSAWSTSTEKRDVLEQRKNMLPGFVSASPHAPRNEERPGVEITPCIISPQTMNKEMKPSTKKSRWDT